MRRRISFIAAVFAATAALMALQKPLFLAFYRAEASQASWHELWLVVWNGLRLDLTMAGYITAPVLLAVIASLWVDLPDRVWRRIAGAWLVAAAVVTSAVFAVDLALYGYWGFRIDGSVMIYLADPKNAMASVEAGEALRQTAVFVLWTAMMSWVYLSLLRLFDGSRTRWRLPWTGALLFIGGLLFLAIRGGVGTSVANVSKVCFSKNMFLNHAAINPVFSLLSTLGGNDDFAAQYDFFPEERRAGLFAEAMGKVPGNTPADTVRLLRTQRPNVALVIMESFSRSILDAEYEGQPVMPRMKELAARSVWFENLYANSFRTDRGQVAILSGFPAQTRISLMKYPAKAPALPSLARSLGREGYRTSFTYGGDLNFTNQRSYLYATGYEHLTWQNGLRLDAPTSKWGYADDVMAGLFASEVEELSAAGGPFFATWLTLSAHEPFDVPYHRLGDKVLNSHAFADEVVADMIERWRAQPEVWDNLLVVLVADHAFPWRPEDKFNAPERHRIPMIWTGGALATPPLSVAEYASQSDLAATLLGQMGIEHSDFMFSRDIFDPALPKFGYYVFNDGFGIVDPSGVSVWDNTTGEWLSHDNAIGDYGKAILQTTYDEIGAM